MYKTHWYMSHIKQKQVLTSLSSSYQKKAWLASAQPKFLLVCHKILNITCECNRKQINSQYHTNLRLAGLVSAKPPFGTTPIKTLFV